MKIIRSSKCSLRFVNSAKILKLREISQEYGRVTNFFIEYFWNNGVSTKLELLKPIVDLPKTLLT